MRNEPPEGFDPAIRAYYEQTPEEQRLEYGAFRLEAARTRELIRRHLPAAPIHVLDAALQARMPSG